MIIFSSVTQAEINEDAVAILAEVTYDEILLGSSSSWIVMPCLAKPFETTIKFDNDSKKCIEAYNSAINNSKFAMCVLRTIVDLSTNGKDVIIGCYDCNITKSHLPLLLDIMEDKFVDEAPTLQMNGG